MTKPSDLLKAGKALIEDPAKWTQGTEARTANLVPVDPFDENACAFCSFGALMKAAGKRKHDAYLHHPVVNMLDDWHLMQVTVNLLSDGFGGSIGRSNDDSTHTEVMEMWDCAIKLAERREEKQHGA